MQALSCVKHTDNCIKNIFCNQLRIESARSGRQQQQQQRGSAACQWGSKTFRRQEIYSFHSPFTVTAFSQGQEALANAARGLAPAELTALLKNCSTFEQLLGLLVLYAPDCNYINASAAYTHAAQLTVRLLGQHQQTGGHSQKQTMRPAPKQQSQLQQPQRLHQQTFQSLLELLPPLLDVLLRHCGQFQGRQVSNSLWATHKLLHALLLQQQQHLHPQQQQQQQTKSGELISRLEEAMQLLLQQAKSCWHLYTGRELVVLLYSLARMTQHHLQTVSCTASITAVHWSDSSIASVAERAVQQLAKLQRRQQLLLKPQELEMLLIAFRVFQRPDLSQQQWKQQQAHPVQALQEQQHTQQQQDQQHAGRNAEVAAKFAVPVSLANQLLVDVVKLHSRKRGQLQGQHRRAARQPQSQPETAGFTVRDAAGLLYSSAVLGLPVAPATIVQVLPQLQGKHLRQCRGVDLANMLYSLALLRFRPADRTWWLGVSVAWQRLLQQKQLHATEQVVAMFALARLKVKLRQPLIDAAAAVLARAFVDSQGGSAALFLWSLGRLGAGVQEETMHQLLQAYLTCCVPAAASPAAGAEAQATTAGLEVPAAPPNQQLIPLPGDTSVDSSGAAAAATGSFESSSNWTHADSRQTAVASKMQLQRQQQAQQRTLKQQAQECGMVVWALGQLGFCPSQNQLQHLLQHIVLLVPHADARCLSSILYGLGQLQYRPGKMLLQALIGRILQVLRAQQLQQQQQVQLDHPQRKQHKGQSPKQQKRQQQGRAKELQIDLALQPIQNVVSELQPDMAAFDSQGLIMTMQGLVRLQPDVMLPELSQLEDVLVTAAQVIPVAPAAAGIVLWSAVRLCVNPVSSAGIVDAAFRALRVLQKLGSDEWKLRQQHRSIRYHRHHHNQYQQQQQQQQQHLQQQRHARSVALMLWGLARVGLSDDKKSTLAKALHGLSAQLQHSNPVDLCSSIWALSQLQLRPPEPWMLGFYAASQANLQQFTDAQLATLAVSTFEVLLLMEQDFKGRQHGQATMQVTHEAQQQQQQQDENARKAEAGNETETEPQQAESSVARSAGVLKPQADLLQQQQQQQQQQQRDDSSPSPAQAAPQPHSVPPALWQLQLELQLRSRWKQRRARHQHHQQINHSHGTLPTQTDRVVTAVGSCSTVTLPALFSKATGDQHGEHREATSRLVEQETDAKLHAEGNTRPGRTADPLFAVRVILRRWRQQSNSMGFDDEP